MKRSIDRILTTHTGSLPRPPDVPLPFFNELRFNYYKETDPDRASLPFSVYVGHAGRQSPQCTHESPRRYVRSSSCKAGCTTFKVFINSATVKV